MKAHTTLKDVGVALALLLLCAAARAQPEVWVSSETVNDPGKEKLCKERAAKEDGEAPFYSFEIDARYVAAERALHSDATFILGNTSIVCYLNQGTGRFQANQFGGVPIRVRRPPEAGPGIRDRHDQDAAANVCLEAARAKDNRADFDHSQWWIVYEVGPPSSLSPPGPRVAGVKPTQYDILVKGTLYFKTLGPDLLTDNYLCLLTPTEQMKAIQTGVHDPRQFPLTH
jgi:hypothetical protein